MRLAELLCDVGRPVAYFPSIARLVGVKECVFVCQLIYWHDKTDDGWIYKSQDEIRAETGLSHEEQATARRNLRRLGLLEERNERLRHRLFYRVKMDALSALWEGQTPELFVSRNRDSRFRGGGNAGFGESANTVSSLDTETTSETTSLEKGASAPVAEFAFPDELRNEAFAGKWAEYLAYRKASKMRSLKPASVAAQLRELSKWGNAAAIDSINATIRNGWQGLFEPRAGGAVGAFAGPARTIDREGSLRSKAW